MQCDRVLVTMERDTIFYLLNRNSPNQREFVSGVVTGGGTESPVVQFSRPWLGVHVDEKIDLHFKHNGRFVCREHHVQRVTEDESGTRLKLLPLGAAPDPCDMRASERIPTVYESMIARLGTEKDCIVLDVSMSGIAVMCGGRFKKDEILEFEMWVREVQYLGSVSVRSVIEVRPGRFRYGLHCLVDSPGYNLKLTLPQLWVSLQIKYLEIMVK